MRFGHGADNGSDEPWAVFELESGPCWPALIRLLHMPQVLQERPGLVAYSMAIVGYFFLIYLSALENPDSFVPVGLTTSSQTLMIASLSLFPAAFFGIFICAGSPRAILHLFRLYAGAEGLTDRLVLTLCLTAQLIAAVFLLIATVSIVLSLFFFFGFAA